MKNIFKIQRPIVGEGDWLMYNEDRSIQQFFVPDADMLKMMSDNLKIYVKGDIFEDTINFTEVVEPQNW